ncbi:MAG: DNA-directed RNA polymerase subunit alpha C-terminal domain-containing protein, partial [Candidatus Aenigmatarchaeota archaeon]
MDSRDIVREYNKRFIEPQIGYRRLASKLTAGLYETLTGKDMLSMPIEEALMGRKGRHRIYKKAVRALNRVGVKTIGDLTELSKADLIGVKGSGPAIVKYIQEELGGYGFGLKEDGATYDIPTALIPAKEAFRKLPRKNYTLRAIKMLDEMGIETLHDLAKFTKEQLLSKGCTENLAEYMKDVLKNYGFYLEGEPIYDGKDALSVPVDEAGFGVWACNVLLSEGLETLGDVVKYSKKDLSKIRNAGEKTIKWIEEGLAKYGLSLRESGQGLEAPSKS